jgi:hypothetical protein
MHSDNDPHIPPGTQLPDGERVDVVYRDHRQPLKDAGALDRALDPLHVCFHCASELVYPLDWIEEGPRHWRIFLRCPDCESRREGVFEHPAVELLDEELDRGTGALLSDLRRMTHANMSEEVEFFIRALAADLILPSDF